MASSGAAAAWTITGQHEDTRQDERGQFVDGIVVSFRTAGNVAGSVFVPATEYTVEGVRGRVDAKARMMDSVSGLQG